MPDHTKMSFEEHAQLAAAVSSRDVARIHALLKDHIERTRNNYAKSLETLELAPTDA